MCECVDGHHLHIIILTWMTCNTYVTWWCWNRFHFHIMPLAGGCVHTLRHHIVCQSTRIHFEEITFRFKYDLFQRFLPFGILLSNLQSNEKKNENNANSLISSWWHVWGRGCKGDTNLRFKHLSSLMFGQCRIVAVRSSMSRIFIFQQITDTIESTFFRSFTWSIAKRTTVECNRNGWL